MIRRNFGRFAAGGIVDESTMYGDTPDMATPSIAGAGFPDTGIRNKSMGDVFPPKEKFTPQEFADKNAAMKRMKQTPGNSPLGPLTSGPPQGRMPQGQPQGQPQGRMPQGPPQGQQQQPGGIGGRWMGELWQGLTMNPVDPMDPQMASPQMGGYASGGAVGPDMSIYHQTMRDLESGGVSGYAQGGLVEQSREIASKGRYGDSMLMHIQPEELEGLQSLLGPLTTNPETGNPEAFAISALLGGLVIGGALGAGGSAALGGNKQEILTAAGMGAAVGAGAGIVAAPAAPAAGAAPIAASATTPIAGAGFASTIPGVTMAGGSLPAATGTTLASTAAPAAGINYAGAAKFAASALPTAMRMGSSPPPGSPPPQMPSPGPMAPPQMSRPPVSPNQSRRAGGIASLQRPPGGMPRGRIGNSLRGRGIA